MNEHDEHAPRHKRRWLSGCLVILGTGLLMLGIAWLLLGVLSERSDDALRAKGYPTTLDELNDWYVEPPYGENAAEYYLEAATLLEQSTFPNLDALPIQGRAELPPLGTPMPEEMRAVIGRFLEHESLAFELIDEGSQFDGVRYTADFNADLTGMLLARQATVRYAVRGQHLRTLYLSGQPNKDTLLEEYEKLVRVAASLRYEPMLVADTVYVAMVRSATTVAERVLNENEFSKEQLADLDASLALLMDQDALLRELVCERCIASAAAMPNSVIGRLHRSEYLNLLDGFIAIAEEGLPNQLDAYKASLNRTYSFFRPYYSVFFTQTLISRVQSYYEAQAGVMAARAAITVQASRLDANPLPESVDKFPESVQRTWPIDPFSGESFIYQRLDEGFVIYSVGDDMKDNGGRTREEIHPGYGRFDRRYMFDGIEKRGDVVFRILK